MKNLFTLCLIWVILAVSNVLFAQYSNPTFNYSSFYYPESLNLSSEKNLGINTNVSNNFNIYPNPNNGKFHIDLKKPKLKIQVDIYNVWGQKIYESSTLLPLSTNEINFSSQPKGIYFVKINDGKENQIEKIIVW